jgi:hypothetical protein
VAPGDVDRGEGPAVLQKAMERVPGISEPAHGLAAEAVGRRCAVVQENTVLRRLRGPPLNGPSNR